MAPSTTITSGGWPVGGCCSSTGQYHGHDDRDRTTTICTSSGVAVGATGGQVGVFDLSRPSTASRCHRVALAAAGEADDHLMSAVVLGHMAFAPAFAGDSLQATALIEAALPSAARESSLVRSWLHCVASEARARAGDAAGSLREIELAEATYVADDPMPQWFDFYDLSRLQCFAGYAATVAGDRGLVVDRLARAADMLAGDDGAKQRSVICADLAAASADDGDQVAHHLRRAADALEVTWYGAGWDRVRQTRTLLGDSRLGRQLDDRLAALPGGG